MNENSNFLGTNFFELSLRKFAASITTLCAGSNVSKVEPLIVCWYASFLNATVHLSIQFLICIE